MPHDLGEGFGVADLVMVCREDDEEASDDLEKAEDNLGY